ncbi:MAG TPA: TetR/AcrR family transcriptional regulator [Phototrophicaceae bacterium]|nr:TetR/AcrR family transcriptional regulator [Phototrophicaceae bacterium]
MTDQPSSKSQASKERQAVRAARRQQEILTVAARLFAEVGYERTTLDLIAEELGLTKPSLYYYVRSKEDVLAHIFRRTYEGILAQVTPEMLAALPPVGQLRRLIAAYVQQACVYPEGRALFLYQPYLISVCQPDMLALREQFQQRLVEAVAQGIRDGVFQVSDAKLAALAIIGALYSLPLWYTNTGPLTPEQIAENYARMLIGGLVNPLPA